MRLRALLAAVIAPLLVVSLAACGQSAVADYVKVAPATIDQDLRSALAAMKSVHVHTVQKVSGAPFVMDISVDTSGRCTGTLAQGTQTLTLIGLGGDNVYAKGSADFWTAAEGVKPATAALLADKWITGLQSGMFTNTCNIRSFVQSLTRNSVAADKAKVLGKTKVAGADAVNLQITLGGTPITVAVDASSPHRPLRVISLGGKLTTELSAFDAPVRPVAPAGAQNLSTLTAGK